MGDDTPLEASGYDWTAMGKGARAALCLAGLVMACSFVGFGALLKSLDFGLLPGLFTNVAIWALPGQVIFVDMWHKGAALPVIAVAVTITAVRLLPMVVLVLARSRLSQTARWPEFVIAHFTAVTIWVMANTYITEVERAKRLPWLLGLGLTLMSAMTVFTTIGYFAAGSLPVPLAAALVFFTPSFFFLALFAGARQSFDYWAIGLGATLGPIATVYEPRFDLLLAGATGGTLAFIIGKGGKGAVP